MERSEKPERLKKPEKSASADPSVTLSVVDLAVGDRVRLPRYGYGDVEQVEGDSVVVRFPGGRVRKFKREFARPVSGSGQKR